MVININEFYREATLRITGNLDIEQSLFSLLKYLNSIMPANIIFLEKWDQAASATRTIARVTLEKGEKVDLLTKLSPQAEKMAFTYRSKKFFLVDKPHEHQLAIEMMNFHNLNLNSLVILPLIIDDQITGSIIIGAEGNEQLTHEHADLISLLREPCAIAISNTSRYRSELKLYQKDFFWEATRRICGNLKIEMAICDTLNYLTTMMPVDKIFIQFFRHELKAFQTIAVISSEEGKPVDMPVPMSSDAIQELAGFEKKFREATKNISFLIEENPLDLAINQEYFSFHKTHITSMIVVPISLQHEMLGQGSFFFVTEGENRFNQEDADLLSLLKEPLAIALSNTLRHQEILKLKDLLIDDNKFLKQELKEMTGENIIGSSFGLKNVMDMVHQIANINSPVILLGETGTGKDLIANAIHYTSSRSNGPFISVNCGAIPDSLIDSELFGHEKGAFTGAHSQKRGRFERAHTGTIFLDEIGELPMQAQVRLLRVLQNREIERVGGTKTIELDIRIIAATNRNIEEMVKSNTFREDLWFRLNVFPITLPPLRERKSDIPAFVQYFLTQKTKEMNLQKIPELEPGSIDILMAYNWPGNVRELENVIERAIILNKLGPINFKHLPQSENINPTKIDNTYGDLKTLDEVIIMHIEHVLNKTEGKIHGSGGAAEILGINASTLRNRMNKLGISYGRDSQ